MVGLGVALGFGDTLPDLLVSARCLFRGANPPGLERSRGLVTPASLLFAPDAENLISLGLLYICCCYIWFTKTNFRNSFLLYSF